MNGRSKQPIIEAANQTLALLAVFVYATHASHATQSIALRALRALRLDGNRALVAPHQNVSSIHVRVGRPCCRSPFTIPSISVFSSRSSGILHIWPKSRSFLLRMMSYHSFLMLNFKSILVLWSCHRTNNIFCSTSSQMPNSRRYSHVVIDHESCYSAHIVS